MKNYTEMWIENCKRIGYRFKTTNELCKIMGVTPQFLRDVPPSINPF